MTDKNDKSYDKNQFNEKAKKMLNSITFDDQFPDSMSKDMIYCACLLQNEDIVNYLLHVLVLYYSYENLRYALIITCNIGNENIFKKIVDYMSPTKIDIDDWSGMLYDIIANGHDQLFDTFIQETIGTRELCEQEVEVINGIISKIKTQPKMIDKLKKLITKK